jgi:hypothetical protein
MADSPQDQSPHAGQVVRRVLLRRNIAIDLETAQLVAAAVQAALQAGKPSPAVASGSACSRRRLRAAVLRWHRLYAARFRQRRGIWPVSCTD